MANSDFSQSQRNTIWSKYFGSSLSGLDAFGRSVTKYNFECDHVWPKSKGGSTTIDNGQPLSPLSNLDKSDKTQGTINWNSFRVERHGSKGVMYVNGRKYTK